jgi:LAGLIDADG endonuclease
MHINDRPLLVYIRNRLGLGEIFPISIESILPEKDKLTSVWEVYYLDDVLKIINIFDKYPLNTTKQLDYLA